ncbi:MAG TPA: SUMF1/EgtB/PvdO family nonheme iron enzyme [Pseudomonadota bacterium]|nr:SUMF1/EgtB/PvdO family nonheme iron enzyme [Pseudomonadota bacterium]
MSRSPEIDWNPPKLFDGYRVLWTISRTEHSSLCMGQDTVLDRPVQIRFLDVAEHVKDQRDRFVAEARAVAKVQHPNVMTVHRVGTIDSRPYIISEYVRGQTVEQLPKPLPWRQVLPIATAAARGLAAAHRRGVLHRSLRPSNILVASDGAIKLTEFGLREFCGEEISQTRAISDGTIQPADSQPELLLPQSAEELRRKAEQFVSPEVKAKEPPTQRADLFALGMILYELILGKLPSPAILAQPPGDDLQAAGWPLDIDARFAKIVLRCLRSRPQERFGSSEELESSLEQLLPRGGVDKIPEGNPYRGLLPFEAEHRSLFFGRRSEIGTLVERLRTDACVLVAAESGVGKSSLCRAGVLPLVAEGALAGGRAWRVVSMVPGRHPLRALAQGLSSVCQQSDDDFVRDISAEPERLGRILHQRLGNDRGLLLFVDQLEELSTIADPREAQIVGEALGSLLARITSVRLLITVRSDYLGRVASLPSIGEAVTRSLYILRPLGPDRIREAVVGPAHVKGVLFESTDLISGLVDSTASTDGALPLLQFTLAELWEAREGNRITQAALDNIGGVTGALSRHADHVIGTLPPAQRQSARRVLMSLVTLEGTRARRTEEELINSDSNARSALEALVRGRLLVARDTADGTAYEVAHEALIKGWITLSRWLEEFAESRAVKQRLETAATEWRRMSRSPDALWSAAQLAELALVESADIAAKEAEFVAASWRNVRKRTLLRNLLIGSLPLLAVLSYSAFEYTAHRNLSIRIDGYLRDGKSDLDAARRRNREVDELRRAAFSAFDSMQTNDGEEMWNRALALSLDAERAYSRAGQTFEAALTADSTNIPARELLADVLYERALIAERDRRPQQLDDLLQRMALYDLSGARKLKWNAPSTISIRKSPDSAQVSIARYERDPKGRRILTTPRDLGAAPTISTTMPPGSYLLTLSAPGFADVRYPVFLTRSETVELSIDLPAQARVPDGFVYVPPGRFLFGSGSEETMRKSMLTAVPIHQVQTGGFLIAKHETTFADWLTFLSALSPTERSRYLSKPTPSSLPGAVGLTQLPGGEWELTIQPTSKKYILRENQKLVYDTRKIHREHDWHKLPVSGISFQDAKDYAAWLAKSGKLPGARLCSELEWERAAKGADDREWPHGDDILAGDANFDATYNFDAVSMGPDEVGSYPLSKSPFGINDMAGNAFEWTISSLAKDEASVRSSSYFFAAIVQRSTNRNTLDPSMRSPGVSMRLCATLSLAKPEPARN